MKRVVKTLVLLVILLAAPLSVTVQAAAVDSLKITFHRNEGMDAFDRIVQEFRPQLTDLVHQQLADPNTIINVRSNADGARYPKEDRKQNVVMTFERSVTGTTLLEHFHADLNRVVIVPLDNRADTGMTYRYILFTLVTHEPETTVVVRESLPTAPQPVQEIIEQHSYFLSKVWLGAGIMYGPAEKLIPFVQGQWGNERLRFIAEAGYSLYHHHQWYLGEQVDVAYRYLLGGAAWRPLLHGQFDIIAAWQRSETYSTHYGGYTRKLEGPCLGVRLDVGQCAALSGLWSPSEVREYSRSAVEWDEGCFFLSFSVYTAILGGE